MFSVCGGGVRTQVNLKGWTPFVKGAEQVGDPTHTAHKHTLRGLWRGLHLTTWTGMKHTTFYLGRLATIWEAMHVLDGPDEVAISMASYGKYHACMKTVIQ